MSVQVWAYLKEYEAEKEEIFDAIEKVLSSGTLRLGESVRLFEEEFARYCQARYGVGVDNGTNAIVLALKAIGVQPGDEVITVSNTAVPTVLAIVLIGATPRLVDIHPTTYLMDTTQLEAAITPRTRCILPVHLFGQCVNMAEVNRIAARHDLLVMEDCAQSHGATFQGKIAGSMSPAASFSFYPTKILGGYGDGGMVITSDAEIDEKLRRLRFYGMDGRDFGHALEIGYNSRLDELHAEILRRKLRHIDEYIARRQALAARYDRLLADTGLQLPQIAPDNTHAYYLYVVRHPQRDRIMEELRARHIFVNISYPRPIHLMEGYTHLGYREGSLPETEAAAREIFSLPMYPSLSNDEQDIVVEALQEIMSAL